jgi:hypothetical protein
MIYGRLGVFGRPNHVKVVPPAQSNSGIMFIFFFFQGSQPLTSHDEAQRAHGASRI